MSRVTCHMSISLDGFVAGPNQSADNPIGVGGMRLHDWHLNADEPGYETEVKPRDWLLAPKGAYVMGRNMFGPVRGTATGAAGGVTSRRTTRPCSSSPITSTPLSRWKVVRRSIS